MIREKSLYTSEPKTVAKKSGGSLSFSDASRSNYDPPARKKSPRQAFAVRILLMTIAIVSVALVGHFSVTGPLEQSLLKEQARCLASELDGIISARSAAVQVAADNLDIDNLSATGGLDRLLSSLRSLFPDFSNIELLNGRGQTLAMMGDLNLSLTGAPNSSQVLVNSAPAEAKLLFHDDPANRGFLIIMRHGDPDSGYWFTRTRFSRTTIESVLASAASGGSPRLIAQEPAKNSSEGSEFNAQNSAAAGSKDGTQSRWWNPAKSTEVQLSVPGWILRLESVPMVINYCPHVLIPSLLLLLLALFYIKQQDSKQPKEFQYGDSSVGSQSVDPEWDGMSEFTSVASHEPERPHRTSTDEIAYSPGDPQIITADSAKNLHNFDNEVEDSHSLGELLPEFFYEPTPDVAPQDPPNDKESDAQLTPIDQFPETIEVTWFEPRKKETQIDSSEPQYVADSKILGA